MNLTEALKEYNSVIDTYYGLDWDSRPEISDLLRRLSVILSYLEHLRSEYHKKWNEISFRGPSVAAGERSADKEVPELYMLRRITKAGYSVLDAMRSNISASKKD